MMEIAWLEDLKHLHWLGGISIYYIYHRELSID